MTGYVKVHCTACEYFEGECTACEGTGEVIQHWDGVEKGYFVPQEVLAVEAVVLGKRQWIING